MHVKASFPFSMIMVRNTDDPTNHRDKSEWPSVYIENGHVAVGTLAVAPGLIAHFEINANLCLHPFCI